MSEQKIEFAVDPRSYKMYVKVDGKAFNVPEGWIIRRDPKPSDVIKRYCKLGIESHLHIEDPIERKRVYNQDYRKLQRDKKNAIQRKYYHSPRGQATVKAYLEKNKERINNWRNGSYDPDKRREYYRKLKSNKN